MTFSRKSVVALLFLLVGSVASFAPAVVNHHQHRASARLMSTKTDESATTKLSERKLSVPLSWEEMVRQVSTAMKEAAAKGDTRQIVRVLLPRDASNADFGKYFEDESDDTFVQLVPPDESWQGGIMQLYRACASTAESILRQVTADSSGLPPRINEDRSIDESGVDGVGLFTAGSVQCFVQPTQEIVDDFVNAAEKANDDQLVVLMNPQWRQVDDALDSASKGEGFLSGLASFLGGKGGVLKRTAEAGYKPVYTLEGYVCRGANVRLLQVLDSEWSVFCERDNKESFVSVGTSASRPTYQQVDAMLQGADIGYKYARDIGLEPKL